MAAGCKIDHISSKRVGKGPETAPFFVGCSCEVIGAGARVTRTALPSGAGVVDTWASLTDTGLVAAAPHTVGETDLYVARCDKLGLSEDVRSAIIDHVANDPAAGVVVRGSGGIRKVRFGGSGGLRLLVAYFDERSPAYLMSVLSKGQQANFTDAQIKVLHALTKSIKANLRTMRV